MGLISPKAKQTDSNHVVCCILNVSACLIRVLTIWYEILHLRLARRFDTCLMFWQDVIKASLQTWTGNLITLRSHHCQQAQYFKLNVSSDQILKSCLETSKIPNLLVNMYNTLSLKKYLFWCLYPIYHIYPNHCVFWNTRINVINKADILLFSCDPHKISIKSANLLCGWFIVMIWWRDCDSHTNTSL